MLEIFIERDLAARPGMIVVKDDQASRRNERGQVGKHALDRLVPVAVDAQNRNRSRPHLGQRIGKPSLGDRDVAGQAEFCRCRATPMIPPVCFSCIQLREENDKLAKALWRIVAISHRPLADAQAIAREALGHKG